MIVIPVETALRRFPDVNEGRVGPDGELSDACYSVRPRSTVLLDT